jgi:uncharacterized membrane protein YfcA
VSFPVIETSFLGVPDVTGWLFAVLSAASFGGAFIAVTMGVGGGVFLLAVMAMFFPPAILIPLQGIVTLGTGASLIVLMWRHLLRATLLPFTGGAILGAALGARIFTVLPTALLQGLIGGFILVLAWLPRLSGSGTGAKRFALLGCVSTFLGMFVGATGVLVAPFVAGASPTRHNHAVTLTALMAISYVIRIVTFGLLGVSLGAYTPLIVVMVATAALGNWIGGRTLTRLPEHVFRRGFQVVLTLLALRLLWVAATKGGLF